LNDMSADTMLGYLYGLPEQFASSLEMKFDFVDRYRKNYSNIVVSGLGGSAIGGDILRTMALEQCTVPVIVNRDYTIPHFVNRNTLFIAISYSGNTEETISAYSQAQGQGAEIVCLTSGGKLQEMAVRDGFSVIKVPGDLVPRAATGLLLAPLVMFLEDIGIFFAGRKALQETVTVLQQQRQMLQPESSIPENQAKDIALKLKGAIPIIWGVSGFSEAAALRWKAQINENSKCPAYYNVFPELNHNEIVGFEIPEEILNKLVIVLLRDGNDHPQVKKRMDITCSIIKEKVKDIIEVHSQGESLLARFYSLTYPGDYASTYLAMEYGINPTPVKVIDYLKKQLAL